MGRRRALVVGVNDYTGRWSPLRCCVNDATQIARLLEMDEYGFEVTEMLNADATRANILRWAAEARADQAEMLLLYFSGHGVTTDLGSFLVTYDNAEYDEGVEIPKLIRILAGDYDAKHATLVFLDCCHSGVAARMDELVENRRPLTNADLQTAANVDRAFAVIAASLSSQVAWEEQNFGHGVFTYYLLQALCGDAADHEGFVTIHSVYDVISRNMGQLTGREEQQKPVFGGHIPGRLVLAGGMTPMLPPPAPEEDCARIETEAQRLLDEFLRWKLRFDTVEWRTSGYDLACRRLENIYEWFNRRKLVPGLGERPTFRQSQETLNRYRTELGLVETGMVVKEGRLETQLGSGGFGSVWKVTNDESGAAKAYKIYHTQEMDNAEKVKRFRNGYDAMALLSHPNIVKVHRFSSCPVGFTMDYVEGQNLRDLDPSVFMEPLDLVALLIDIASAVEHAHENDVIHRDIKPENIVCKLGGDGRYVPYLTDFDLAWFSTRTQNATKSALGVIFYAAPEQYSAFDPKAAIRKSPSLDVFSFGQLLYFCFVGRDPDPVRLSRNLSDLQKAARGQGSNEAMRQLSALYKDATEWSPADRIQNFGTILERLWKIKDELSYTRGDEPLTKESFLAELIYQLTNDPRDPGEPEFTSRSGNWRVHFEWGSKTFRGITGPALTMQFNPNGRIGFENMANERMRRILNERVDTALRPYKPNATRHRGQKGAFEVFVEYGPVRLDRNGIEPIRLVIHSTLDALERN